MKSSELYAKETFSPVFLSQLEHGKHAGPLEMWPCGMRMFDQVPEASSVCVCVCSCVRVVRVWECTRVWLCTHSEHMSVDRSRGSLSHCGEATEVWAVWQWHEVTDRLRQILGQWVGCVDSTVCMSVCECTWLCKFLYCTYSTYNVVYCAVRKNEHRGVSPMAVILAPEKGLRCTLLFPHWQTTYWQGLPLLHPNKQREIVRKTRGKTQEERHLLVERG